MNKISLIAVTAATLALGACANGTGQGVSLNLGLGGLIGSHLGIGTSVNIPLGGTAQKNPADGENRGGLRVIEHQVITFFDAQGQTTNSAVKNGYYRELVAKQNDQTYVVQDFYGNGNKRTDPMTLAKDQLFEFRAHPHNGAYTVYAINGNIMQQQNCRNGKLIPK